MTQFESKSFSVQMGGRKPEGCTHGMLDVRGKCAFCGMPMVSQGLIDDYRTLGLAAAMERTNFCGDE